MLKNRVLLSLITIALLGYSNIASARYTQSDPIGLKGGNNTFTYAEGNPVSKFDPDGQYAIPIGGAAAIFCARNRALCFGAALAACQAAGGCSVPIDSVEQCKDDRNGVHCSKASSYHLSRAGIVGRDAEHAFKRDYVISNESSYDICACEDGTIKISGQGQCGVSGSKIDTWATWK